MGVRVGRVRGVQGREEAGEELSEEGPEGWDGGGYDGEVGLDGGEGPGEGVVEIRGDRAAVYLVEPGDQEDEACTGDGSDTYFRMLVILQTGLLTLLGRIYSHEAKRKDSKQRDLEPSPHLETKKRPERKGQDGDISRDNNSIIRVVERDIVNATPLRTRHPVQRDGLALQERDAEDGYHGAGVDGLQDVDGIPDRGLHARYLPVEAEDRGLDEAEDGVVEEDDEPFEELGGALLVEGEFGGVPVVYADVVELDV